MKSILPEENDGLFNANDGFYLELIQFITPDSAKRFNLCILNEFPDSSVLFRYHSRSWIATALNRWV